MAKKEEYHNLEDLEIEKMLDKIREEVKEEKVPERLKPEHLNEILTSQKKKGGWPMEKKRKYMVAAAWAAVLVGIGVSSVALIQHKVPQTASVKEKKTETLAEEKQVEGYKSASSYEEIYQKLFVETKKAQEAEDAWYSTSSDVDSGYGIMTESAVADGKASSMARTVSEDNSSENHSLFIIS